MSGEALEAGEAIDLGASALLISAYGEPPREPSEVLCKHDVPYKHGCIHGCKSAEANR